MSAKYCREYKCGANDGRPCTAADDCFLFKWDIERQKGICRKTEKRTVNKIKEEEGGKRKE